MVIRFLTTINTKYANHIYEICENWQRAETAGFEAFKTNGGVGYSVVNVR